MNEVCGNKECRGTSTFTVRGRKKCKVTWITALAFQLLFTKLNMFAPSDQVKDMYALRPLSLSLGPNVSINY